MAEEKVVQSVELDRRNEVDTFAEESVKTSEQHVSCSLLLVNIYQVTYYQYTFERLKLLRRLNVVLNDVRTSQWSNT